MPVSPAPRADTRPGLRSVMVANGDRRKRIWATEMGAPTTADPASEREQADQVRDAFRLVRAFPWAGPMFWYTHIDLRPEYGNPENHFGLIRFDGSRKPAFTEFRRAARARP